MKTDPKTLENDGSRFSNYGVGCGNCCGDYRICAKRRNKFVLILPFVIILASSLLISAVQIKTRTIEDLTENAFERKRGTFTTVSSV